MYIDVAVDPLFPNKTNLAVKLCYGMLFTFFYQSIFMYFFMEVQRMEMNRNNLVEQFYKYISEFFISKAFFRMEYDKKKP